MKYLVVIASFFMGLSAFAESKVGYFDLQRALQATEAGQKAKADLESKYSSLKKDLEKKKAEIDKAGQELQRKKSVLSESAFAKKEAALQEQMAQFQNEVMKNQNEMQKHQAELLQPIVEKLQKAASDVAHEKGYSMIFEKGQDRLFFAEKDLDLTDAIVKAVNKN